MKKHLTLILTLAIALGSTLSFAADGTRLQYKYKKGDILNYLITSNVAGTLEVIPDKKKPEISQKYPVDMKMELMMKMTVTDIDRDKNATIENTFDSVRLLQSGVEAVNFKKGDPIPAEHPAAKILDANLTSVIAPNGEMVHFKGLFEIIDFISTFDLESIMRQASAKLSDYPVKPGDRWSGKLLTIAGVDSLDLPINYKYISDEDFNGIKCAKIETQLTADISKKVADKLIFSGKIANVENYDVTLYGTLYFDSMSGRVVSYKAKTTAKSNMDVGDTVSVKFNTYKSETSINSTFELNI